MEPASCCFLCLEVAPPNVNKRESETSSINSLQCLSRYLKMNFMEVLNERREKVNAKKTKPRVALCEDCTNLIDKFSKLFSRLEKTEMEVGSCLSLIHQKLLEAGKTSKVNHNGETNSVNYKYYKGVIENEPEVVEIFRKDAIKKSSHKLNILFPRIKVRKLSPEQVQVEQRKVKSSSANRWSYNFAEESYEDLPEIEIEDIIKLEIPLEDAADEIDRNSLFNELNSTEQTHISTSTTLTQPYIPIPKQGHSNSELFHYEDTAEELPPNLDSVELDNVGIFVTRDKSKPTAKKRKPSRVRSNDNMPGIDPPIKVVGINGTAYGESSVNPTTGKYKCRHCPKEFVANKNFESHYYSVHLKVRYKCRHCGKEFPYKQGYDNHYLSVHIGVRFKCIQCGKMFAAKSSLRNHHHLNHHLGRIGKWREGSLQSNNKQITSEVGSNSDLIKCDICHLEVSDLSTHLCAVHLEAEGADLENDNLVTILLPPVKVVGNSRKAQSSINAETGKQKCSLCQREFETKAGFLLHHRTVHNGERFRCTLCRKLFTQRHIYRHHFRTVHMAASS